MKEVDALGVLVFLLKDDNVLLARKMSRLGAGRLNGYGGGVEQGETPRQAAVRELEEETRGDRKIGVFADPNDLEKVADVSFHNTKADGSNFVCRVIVFFLRKWTGDAISTEEMAEPMWYQKHNMPFDQMCPGDEEWLSLALSGEKFWAKVYLGPGQRTLLEEKDRKGVVIDRYVESDRGFQEIEEKM